MDEININTGREDWVFVRPGEYTFATFSLHAQRTIRPDNTRELLLNGALGIVGEAGEIADLAMANAIVCGRIADGIKKHVYHGKPLDGAKLLDEIGDAMWYLNELAIVAGGSLELCARYNNAKLFQRFNGAAFAEERAAAQAEKAQTAAARMAILMGAMNKGDTP